ncbi:fungal-specific transcription factor domain-containing protein [Exophiala viscosa]|uniref:fungal-specific transcription factor domain-containing protein n=1 Tax=Exophiala viscosa TaxID=2486360 RepID=UPI002193B356|nr:fungal-specific transcription factor domain-containing protein [Exophiala viscosa]
MNATKRHKGHDSHNRSPISMARSNITACLRCRHKKKRCDQQLPKCRMCQNAGVECVSYDAVARRQIPRSYVHSLEERVAYLEMKLQERGGTDLDLDNAPIEHSPQAFDIETSQTAEHSPLGASTTVHLARVSSLGADVTFGQVSNLVQRNSTHEPAFRKVLLRELMNGSMGQRPPPSETPGQDVAEEALTSQAMTDLDTSPVALPTKDGAESLVKAYFQFANQSLPLLHEPTFRQRLDSLYAIPRTVDLNTAQTSRESRMDIFFVYEAFAVALLILQKQDPSRIPTSLADRYHQTALKGLVDAGLPNDLEGVQSLLLLAQYSYHHPIAWTVWKTIGAALRLAVEVGLHQDPPAGTMDCLTLDNWRRTFWVAYAMDRNVSVALGLPLCLSDGAITAKFPSQENDECITPDGINVVDENAPKPKRVSIHVFRYRRIQSEMQTVLYENPSVAACPTMDLCRWQEQMHNRIQCWYNDTPRRETLTDRERKNLENFELTYHRALLYLYRPSRNIPSPLESSLLAVAEAATHMIRLYPTFFREHRLTIYWQAVENLLSAGTALLYSYVDSPQCCGEWLSIFLISKESVTPLTLSHQGYWQI